MRLVTSLSLTCLVACSGGTISHMGPDGSADLGGRDGAATDAARDTGGGLDAGTELGPIDLGPIDSGPPDLGPVDAGPPDSGFIPCPGGPTELDLHLATIYDNPPDLADWPITTTLTEVDFVADGTHLEFSKKDGPGRWPDIVPPGWGGPLQYTIGIVECIGGAWHTSAAIQVWYGLDPAGGNIASDNNGDGAPDQIAVNWYYDGRWGALAGRQPATGEMIGIFVAAGNLRGVTSDTPLQSPVMERSNVVLVPMPDVTGATHTF